jgi:hypothetical protein
MVPFVLAFVVCVGMYERAQWSSINHKPGNESPELFRVEQIDLEHGNRMWAYRLIK